LRGPAYLWWHESEGVYPHSQRPAVGAILVFKRTRRMPEGHVAVVSAILSNREILVTQANWVRRRAQTDQPVLDVSPRNDWTEVRVWWEPSGTFGRETYATYGFILPPRPPSRQAILAAFPAAAE
jgi:surface antigen